MSDGARTAGVVALLALLLLILLPLPWGVWGWGMGWMWSGFLSGLLIVGLVVVIVFATASPATEGQGRAREILDERYARGEIDEDDYRSRRRELQR